MADDPTKLDAARNPGKYEIIVNGRPYKVAGEEVTYDQIIDIAYPDGGRGPQISYTVTYYKGGDKPEGGLGPGETTKVQDGTVFNVTRTDRS